MNYKILLCSICLVFIMCGTLFAQSIEELQRLIEQHAMSQQKERSRTIQEMRYENPTLANFEQKLTDIAQQISAITADYVKGRINKKTAAEKLRPLIKQTMAIRSDPDYLTEKQIYSILQSAK